MAYLVSYRQYILQLHPQIYTHGTIATSTYIDLFENFFFDQSIYRFKFTGIYSLTLN
jgi:hypothetical protein